jgi:HEAT repeat protein
MSAELAHRHRTAPELATLLLELSRLIRARRYYPPGDARLADVFNRSLRAWRTDLERRGALDLELLPQGFRERGGRGVLAHPQLGELQNDLAERGVHELRFDAALDGEAFAAFAEVLATDAGRTATRGGFAAALYAHTPFGIRVNGTEPEAANEDAVPPTPEEEKEEPLMIGGAEIPSISAALSSADDLGGKAPSHDLDEVLAQLDACQDPGTYPDLARRASQLGERAFETGDPDAAFRAAVRLATHAESRDSERIRDLAESFLRSMVHGALLEDMVERAAQTLDRGDLAASRVLLVVGAAAVPALLDAAVSLEGKQERGRIDAVLLTLVECALPAVIERLGSGEPAPRLRAVARIAGELQHPELVGPLAALLRASDRSVREEAVRGLARIASDAALAELARTLNSDAPGLAGVALQALGGSGRAAALPHLDRVLGNALEARDVGRAKEAIRALGRLGLADAARGLVALLGRRAGLGGGWLRELKSAAVAALAGLPGDDAVAALAKAARSRDSQLRRAAQTALDRRAQARARVGA